MDELVQYHHDGTVSTITLDDGKVNALSPAMLAAVNAALDRAEADSGVLVLGGRTGAFSAGFDLGVLRAGGADAAGMVRSGFELSTRLLAFPRPVVVACTGHAVAMGVFLVLSGDYRVGATGRFRLVANEVAIGLTMPEAGIEVLRQRLTPAAFTRALLLSEPFTPQEAVPAGFLDEVVPEVEVSSVAAERAAQFATLDRDAHAVTKRRARKATLDAMRAAIESDAAELARALV